ncbi:MAG TPA: nitrogenase component 1 [Spirochaetia bacterium]|nr:nitrogenase component 1 [Spirochaetia bacterium]
MPIEVTPDRAGHVVLQTADAACELPISETATLPGVISQRACALYGARWMLAAIKDVIHLVHGPVGCAYNAGTVRRKSYQVFTTGLDEQDVIFGGRGKLARSIEEAVRLRPGAQGVMVYVTCTAALIGEYVEAVCREATVRLGIPVAQVNCPGFCGVGQGQGQDAGAATLLEFFIGRETGDVQRDTVNLLGEFDVQGDLREIEKLLSHFGLKILCAVSGRATVENLGRAHLVALNVVHCRRTGQAMADVMEQNYGTPQLKASFFGLAETAKSLKEIADFFGFAEAAEWIEEQEAVAREKAAPYVKSLTGKRVALFFGASRMGSMAKAFQELGLEMVLAGSQFGCQGDYQEVKRCSGGGTVFIDDANERELSEFLHRHKPDLLVGGTREKYLAHKLGIPFLIFPQETSAFAGFTGFVNLARDTAALLNAPVWRLVQRERQDSPPQVRVAVASREGSLVDSHFGRANSFIVFDLKNGLASEVEVRKTGGADLNCEDGSARSSLEDKLALLADCKAVFCRAAGHCARDLAAAQGLEIIETDAAVESVLADYIRQHPPSAGTRPGEGVKN